jgi:hypothetical protein
VVTVMVLVDGYWPQTEPLTLSSRAAQVARRLRSSTPAKLYVYETILERLAQDLQDMAAELGQFIQEEHTIVGQRHFARHRHVAAADQPRIRDGMMGRATRAGRDQRHTVAGEAGDAAGACALKGFGESHGRQDGGEVACPPSYGHVNCAKRCWVSVMIQPTGIDPVPFHQVAWCKG